LLNKLILAALAAVILVSLAVAPATARTRIEISTTTNRASGRLTFQTAERTQEIICDVTLHATLRRLINKRHGEPVGLITAILTANARAAPNNPPIICRGNAPMELLYGGILGSLPRPTGGILLTASNFDTGVFGIRCNYRATIGATSNTNPIRRATIDPNRIRSSTFGCPEGSLRGELTFSPEVTMILLEA
jgi:hypothetical protein